jgi:Flp pilus assembly protein TadD
MKHQRAFAAALAEYRTAQASLADRPEGHANLGSLAARMGDVETARREYDEGIAVGPWFAGLWINLADLLREQNDDAEGEKVLRKGLAAATAKAGLHHALGLNLARQKRTDEALVELRNATLLEPDETRFAYVYGVALLSATQDVEAFEVLEQALVKRPGDRDLLFALATAYRDRGDFERARNHARRLAEISPGNPDAQKLVEEIEAALQGER